MTERPCILVADKDLDTSHACAMHLSRAGFDTVYTDDAWDAIELLAIRPFDLVLTDLTLPDLSELLQRVRKIKGDIPIIVFTDESLDPATIAAGLHVSAFLTKGPASGPELVEAVEHALSESPR